MFDDPKDINRDLNARDPNYVPPPADDTGWGLPLAIVAIILVIGGLFMFGRGENTQTAQNQPGIERPATPPAATPAPLNPAPPTAPPKQ
jgi:hypothetical protein